MMPKKDSKPKMYGGIRQISQIWGASKEWDFEMNETLELGGECHFSNLKNMFGEEIVNF